MVAPWQAAGRGKGAGSSACERALAHQKAGSYRLWMRKTVLIALALIAPVASFGADFGTVQLPDWSRQQFDFAEGARARRQQQMDELTIQMQREELERRREERAQQARPTYYCKLPDGRFVVCR